MIQEPLFQAAVPVLERIEAAGFEAYFVGGSVRDALLGKAISDVDIATSATPQEIKAIFSKTVDVGIEHGTVLVLYKGEGYEVTTFRTESTYQDFRRPDAVTFVRSLEEDLKRRDFTINALALDARGKLYDFHQGKEDLEAGLIRAVGDPEERFHEDALRMMRGVRFVAQLGFDMDPATQQGIAGNASLLEKIAIERIRVEYQKMVTAPHKARGLDLFIETGLSQHTPGFEDGQEALRLAGQVALTYDNFETNFAAFCFYRYGQTVSGSLEAVVKTLNHWKLSNQEKRAIVKILDIVAFRQERDWTVFDLFDLGPELALLGESLALDLGLIPEARPVEALYEALPLKSLKDLALNGKEIMAVLQQDKGGPYLGRLIEGLKEAILLGQLANEKSDIRDWLMAQNLDELKS